MYVTFPRALLLARHLCDRLHWLKGRRQQSGSGQPSKPSFQAQQQQLVTLQHLGAADSTSQAPGSLPHQMLQAQHLPQMGPQGAETAGIRTHQLLLLLLLRLLLQPLQPLVLVVGRVMGRVMRRQQRLLQQRRAGSRA
jgi:hypothetical protein